MSRSWRSKCHTGEKLAFVEVTLKWQRPLEKKIAMLAETSKVTLKYQYD